MQQHDKGRNQCFSGKKKKPSHERAMDWFKANMVPGQGIIVHTKQPVPYPEVTGYFIPTLYNWGEKELARTCTRWLLSIQLPDGAFPAPDGVPYTFDTAQIMRGLCAALDDVDGAEDSLRRACDWMLTQVDASGRLKTPSTELWTDIASDLIHTYALPPLAQAGKLLGVKEYEEAAKLRARLLQAAGGPGALQPPVAFPCLCHGGAVRNGRAGTGRAGHGRRRTVPARATAAFRPTRMWTGCARPAWRSTRSSGTRWATRNGRTAPSRYLEKIQNQSGGFFGSYGKGAKYIAGRRISWGVKYFLDAWLLKLRAEGQHA